MTPIKGPFDHYLQEWILIELDENKTLLTNNSKYMKTTYAKKKSNDENSSDDEDSINDDNQNNDEIIANRLRSRLFCNKK